MAETVALSRPEVVRACPISPQTHIVEGLGETYISPLAVHANGRALKEIR